MNEILKINLHLLFIYDRGRLLDLAPALAQDPSARTTFKKISICKKTQTAHRDDASKNIS
jgi:hypothetical protein